ncbi:hypothetical protein [Lentzea cavernae]|uniref:Uncharacterized protein n=1 Tax=Lentzea cavernae TaxID=2020703 RepID=A0ABQ3MKC8_9PSEU|nr:hypothetical protein [Lentzea cavernae]GHH46503.1 hypothetical protein GCM10017774_49530 [Lentzea cavernae]
MTEPLPGRPPGHPDWLRILVETNAAQRVPLADGAERTGAIDPAHWTGAARNGFTASVLKLASQFRAALDVHGATSDEIGGYTRFVHELQHLWADEPAERHRWNALYNTTSSHLAQVLQAKAARLDELVRDPAPAGVPAAPVPLREHRHPEPHKPEPQKTEPRKPGRREPEPQDTTHTNVAEEPRFEPRADPAALFRERVRDHELLTELMQAGRRIERIPWRRPLV